MHHQLSTLVADLTGQLAMAGAWLGGLNQEIVGSLNLVSVGFNGSECVKRPRGLKADRPVMAGKKCTPEFKDITNTSRQAAKAWGAKPERETRMNRS